MSKSIIINYLVQETRVAVKENNQLSEIYYERKKDKTPVGNIYKGKVLKVLPGMGAAFVDIGLSKAAFLYVDDISIDLDKMLEQDNGDDDSIDGKNIPEPDQKKQPDKDLKINELIRQGQDIIVQVVKGQIGMKGARITCRLSIPGRNIVLMPQYNNIAISRQISTQKERNRLRNILNKYKPGNAGFIIRTVAQRKQEEEFVVDVEYLKEHWDQIQKKNEELQAPALLYEELTLTKWIMREFLNNETEKIIIDNFQEYQQLKKYLERYLPNFIHKLQFYDEKRSLFDFYDINVQIDRALNRKVVLNSGGYLIIDQAEALTAIDINTGSFIGTDNHEETILKTNLEATSELVSQVKLRDIGGIIIIDYIDMEKPEHREKVYAKLKAELKRDKAKSRILAISELGLVEMTRKRSQESLNQYLCETCPICNGSGKIKGIETVINDLLRDIHEYNAINPGINEYLIKVHQDIKFQLENDSFQELKQIERQCNSNIFISAENFLTHEQYEIFELQKTE